MRIQVTGEAEPDAIGVTGGQPATVIEVDTTLIVGTVTSVNGQTGAVTLNAANVGALAASSNLSDLANAGTARTNLGLGGAATLNVGTASGTVAAGNDSRITGAAQKASNLSDLASASTARTNLGLGGAATLAVGTTTGTVAAGDDSRITGAAQKASNLSDLASASTARTNLGLGGSATLNVGTASGTVAAGNDTRITGAAQAANNLSDLSNKVTAAQNLGILGKNCTANETNSTTSQQASTQLVVPVAANATYAMMAKLVVQTPSGINFVHGWTAPSGATMVWGDSSTVVGTIGGTDSWSGTGATKWANIFGTLITSANAGNLTVTFASGTASNTATLAAGSQVVLIRIA